METKEPAADNVVDLAKHFALDARTHGFFNAIKSLNAVLELLGNVIGLMNKADQRFLCQIIGWRMMGGSVLPATQGLVHQPMLLGMGFDELQLCAERLTIAGVVQNVVLKSDSKGRPTETGFVWPELDTLLEQGKRLSSGPTLTGLDGRPLTTK